MKTLLFSILVTLTIYGSQAQTTTGTTTVSQQALKTFEDTWLSINYTGMTSAQKTTHIQNWVGLKIAVAKENELNRIATASATIAENAAQEAQALAEKQEFVDKLKSIGFAVDNSLADWERLYNYPEIHGSTYKEKAALSQVQSTGVDYFLNVASAMLYSPYEAGKVYKIGDTFSYQGELYSVIQAHISQNNWLPNSTASLYKKATISGTITAWEQRESTNPYKLGEKVYFNGFTYESLINTNTWSPAQYPAGWKKL